ncbi:MAG: metallophosphoesterase [Bacteroidota bacterium]
MAQLVPPINLTPSINDSIESIILESIDGPYLFRNKDDAKLVRVVASATQFYLNEEYLSIDENTTITCTVNNEDRDQFTIPIIQKLKSPKSVYKSPKKLLAISDIEGNFNAFYSLLVANGVMDEQYNWTFGEGHLVLNGDFMDRGKSVTQVLWLIYKLEQAAEEHGGQVHFILGNHEVLNLTGQTNYVAPKYIRLAQKIAKTTNKEKAYQYLMNENQELVRWMKTKNAIEKIGNILFVHGGVSPELVKTNFSIEKINQLIRGRLENGPSADKYKRMDEDFLMASHGPLWYRGLAVPYRDFYKRCTSKEVQKALKRFKVDHISIGHTITQKVTLEYGGKLIRTDVSHGKKKKSAQSQALFVENNILYRVDAAGGKEKL